MFRKLSLLFGIHAAMTMAVLLAYPCATFAQRGGGHAGGGSAGGGGLSSTGKATGVDEKDDLKDFHEVLAVQATTQQLVDYAAMMKSTEAANAELKTFLERLRKENTASDLPSRSAMVQQAVEGARTEQEVSRRIFRATEIRSERNHQEADQGGCRTSPAGKGV
jgi:hypothetical protein